MSELADSLKNLKYDKRMLNWNLRQKLVTKEEYEKHLSKLEDISHLKEAMGEELKTKDIHSSSES